MDTESFMDLINNKSPRQLLRSHMSSNDKEAIDTPLALRDAREKRKNVSQNPPSAKKTKSDGLRQKVLRRRSIQAQDASALESSILIGTGNKTYANLDISLNSSDSSVNESINLPHNTRFKSKRKGALISASQPEPKTLSIFENDPIQTKKKNLHRKLSTTSTTSKKQEKEVSLPLDKTYSTVNSSLMDTSNETINLSSMIKHKRGQGRRTLVTLSQPNPTLAPISTKTSATSEIAEDSYATSKVLDSSNDSLESSILKKRSGIHKKNPKRLITSEFTISTNKTNSSQNKDTRLIGLLSHKSPKDGNKMSSKSNRSPLSRSLQAEGEMDHTDSSFETSKIEFERKQRFIRKTSHSKVDLLSILNKAKQSKNKKISCIPEEDSQEDSEIGSQKSNSQSSENDQKPESEEYIEPLELSDDLNETFEKLENDNEQLQSKNKNVPSNSEVDSQEDSEISPLKSNSQSSENSQKLESEENIEPLELSDDLGDTFEQLENDNQIINIENGLQPNNSKGTLESQDDIQDTEISKNDFVISANYENKSISEIPNSIGVNSDNDAIIPNQIISIPETQSSSNDEFLETQSTNEDDSSNSSYVSDSENEIDNDLDPFDKLMLNSTYNYSNTLSKSFHDKTNEKSKILNKSSHINEAKSVSSVKDKSDINIDVSPDNSGLDLKLSQSSSQEQTPLPSPEGYDIVPNDTIPPPLDFRNEDEKENAPNNMEVSFSSADSDDNDLQSQIADSIASLSDDSPVKSPLQELPQSYSKCNSPLAKGGQVLAKSPYKPPGTVTPIKNTKLHSSVVFSNKSLSSLSQFTTPERKRKSSGLVAEENPNLITPDKKANISSKQIISRSGLVGSTDIVQNTKKIHMGTDYDDMSDNNENTEPVNLRLNETEQKEGTRQLNISHVTHAVSKADSISKNLSSVTENTQQLQLRFEDTNVDSATKKVAKSQNSSKTQFKNSLRESTGMSRSLDNNANTEPINLRLDETEQTEGTRQLNISHVTQAVAMTDSLSKNLSSVTEYTQQLQLRFDDTNVDSATKKVVKSQNSSKTQFKNSLRESTGMSRLSQEGDGLYSKQNSSGVGNSIDTEDLVNTTFNKTNIKTYSRKSASLNDSMNKTFEKLSSSMNITDKSFNETNIDDVMEDDKVPERSSNENDAIACHSKSFNIESDQDNNMEESEKNADNSEQVQNSIKLLEARQEIYAETNMVTSASDISKNSKVKGYENVVDISKSNFDRIKDFSFKRIANSSRHLQNESNIFEDRKKSNIETGMFTLDTEENDINFEESQDIEKVSDQKISNITPRVSHELENNVSNKLPDENQDLTLSKRVVENEIEADLESNVSDIDEHSTINKSSAKARECVEPVIMQESETQVSSAEVNNVQNNSIRLYGGAKESDIDTELFTSDSEAKGSSSEVNNASKNLQKNNMNQLNCTEECNMETEVFTSDTESQESRSEVNNVSKNVQNNSIKLSVISKQSNIDDQIVLKEKSGQVGSSGNKNISSDQENEKGAITALNQEAIEDVSNEPITENVDKETSQTRNTKIIDNEIENRFEGNTINVHKDINATKSLNMTNISKNGSRSAQTLFAVSVIEEGSTNSQQNDNADEYDNSDSDTSIGAQNMLNYSRVSNNDNIQNVLNQSQESNQPQESNQDNIDTSNNELQNMSLKKISQHKADSIRGVKDAVIVNTKQMTMRDFLNNLSKKPLVIPSSSSKNQIEKNARLAERIIQSNKIKPKPVIKKTAPKRTTKQPEEPSAYPPKMIKTIFEHFSKLPLKKDALASVIEANEEFWKSITNHLLVLLTNDGKGMGKRQVTDKHIIRLMKRQKLVTSDEHLSALIHEHLPMEMIRELLPTCRAENVYPPGK